jgi:hypothetical protein
MLRHPARHYIYYLFSKRALNTEQVLGHLDELRLPLPQDAKELTNFTARLIAERQKMRIPANFDPSGETVNAETANFLMEWKIFDIWRRDPFVGAASDVLNEPLIRRMVEALLLGPLSPAAVARRVRERFGLPEAAMNVAVIKAFTHYYWDISCMSMPEWRAFITKNFPDTDNQDFLAAAMAPRNAAGAAVVLALTDRSADTLTPAVRYQAMLDQAWNMFMGHSLLQTRPSIQRTQGALLAFQMVKMADDELAKHRGGSADLLEEFRRIDTIYDQQRLNTVQDLPALRAPARLPAIIDVEPLPADPDKEIV